MSESMLHCRNFLVHLQERPGSDGPVLLKEPAREPPLRSHIEQLHNEYDITCQLADVAGVRPALAKEGTESRPVLHLEYIQGHSLAELIHTASLDLAEKLRLALNVTRALSHVHDHHVMHKDVNSSNILVADGDSPGSQGGVYIIDFGIASTVGTESPSLLAADDTLMGTVAYVSPEQTGRMNRQVDSRTDLYSLGVTLYELFTSQLPFDSGDVLEMIHDHIAREPKPPQEIESGIPGPVSDIVLRLLAKDPDDRYQTARGLQADLESCLDQWQKKGRIEPFELGGDDYTGRLQIPQKLYGRQAEIEHLQTILDRAVIEQAQLFLVAGYSGVGKTSLVREIQKDVIAKQGAYIEGKFDQLQRTLPYSAWAQAFTQLVNNWLAQSESSIAGWRDTILDAVGDHGQVLINVIPTLARVLGPQPDVPQLGGVENQNRINHFFQRFIACLATPEHPLVIFLDDLQWIDPASLNLIEALFAGQSESRLLVVGAYRSNEVGATHPLAISQDRLQSETDRVTVLILEDLSPDDTNHLLADSLRLGVADCRDLGRVLVEKSAGNPFFFRQLLVALEADGLLKFHHAQRRWMWDDGLAQNVQAHGSVVDLMIEKIRALSADTQRALSLAACIGSRFDLTTLHTIVEHPRGEVLTALSPAQQSGLIFRSDGHFSFAHDRIQEAGYSLIPASDRPRIHLEIGRSLLARAKDEELERDVFTIVGHLNVGRSSIDSGSEKVELAALNLAAGQKSKAASAFADAKEYLEVGLDQLRTNSWLDHNELTLSLHTERGELAALTGQYDQVQTTADVIHANARTILDRVRIYMTQIEAQTGQYEFAKALQIGLDVLRGLGVEIPPQPTPEDSRRLNDRLVSLLTTTPAEKAAQLPRMSDETALAASALLASEMSTAYIGDPPLFPIISYNGAILTLEFGLDVWSPFFIGGVALVSLASVDGDTPLEDASKLIRFNRQLVEVIRHMLDDPVVARSRTKGLMMLAFVLPWIEPIEQGIEIAQATYHSADETGDWLYGSYGAVFFSILSFAAGMNLDSYGKQLSAYLGSIHRLGQISLVQVSIFAQTAQHFRDSSPEHHELVGKFFDENEWLPGAIESNDVTGRHYLYICKLMLAYHFDVDETLEEYAAGAEEFLVGGPCVLSVALFYLYFALAQVRLLGGDGSKANPGTMDVINQCLNWMAIWSEAVPPTFQHKYDLMAAERARVTDDLEGALSHYERAINGARASGFTHEEALANELYARFWEDRGHERFAGPLMREAHSLYLKWGARAKAEHLATRFPNLLIGRSVVGDQPGTQIISDGIPGELDLRTVLKASQDIASEIRLDSLLARLMTNVIENTGAQRGFLILERDGRWMIEARASVDEPKPYARTTDDIAGSDLLAEGIVRYVASTQETVVLDDASNSGRFVDHRYVQAHRARSILCAPLINQGETSAILYLENNLSPCVFSPQRVSLLKMLSSQMAISIDNARIHADLESLLEARSKALASAEAQVRTLFEDSPLGIALSDSEGRFLSVNKAVLKMLRITEEELLEHSVVDFYDDPSDRDALLRRVNESGFVQDFGVQLLRHDGTSFHASMNISPLALEGNEVLLAMVQDVTAQIMAEQETAALEERARLARELHDAVSQTILSASLLADATVRTAEEGRAIETRDLTKLNGMLRGALDEMRTLLLEMRPTAVRDRTLGQLLAPMAESARARSGAKVNLRIEGDRVLPENVTTHLQRIAQESLNNAMRHAEAKMIDLDLVCSPEGVALRITDDGRGFDVERLPAGHHGLSIMAERAQEIGAVLEIHSTIDGGTEVSVSWS